MKKILSILPKIELWYGDSLLLMGDIVENFVDLIITDPPYNLKRFQYNDNLIEEKFKTFSTSWLNECYRVLKPNHLLFFTFWSDGMYEMYQIIKRTQFNFVQTLIWYYPNISGFKAKPLYIRTFDPIFVLSKSKPRKLSLQKGISSNDCWNMLKICKPQSNYKIDKLIHPTQKPLELFSRIITENSDEGNLILDPFAGAFTTGKACLELKRSCIGIEMDKHFYCDGIRRIKV